MGLIPEQRSRQEQVAGSFDANFVEILAEHGDAIYSTARRLGEANDAEDLAAETFLRAYATLSSYEPARLAEMRLRPFLVTILLNLWRNDLRRRACRPVTAGEPIEKIEVADKRGDPAEAAVTLERRAALIAALGELSTVRRTAVVLRHIGDLSFAEVAEVLGCPEVTARSHVARALKQLQRDEELAKERM